MLLITSSCKYQDGTIVKHCDDGSAYHRYAGMMRERNPSQENEKLAVLLFTRKVIVHSPPHILQEKSVNLLYRVFFTYSFCVIRKDTKICREKDRGRIFVLPVANCISMVLCGQKGIFIHFPTKHQDCSVDVEIIPSRDTKCSE